MRRGNEGSRQHLLWSNFWALPCTMIAATVVITALLVAIDARGGAEWVAERGWPFAFSGKTAQELASGLVTVHAAFSTLYFSISLLVLTLAASNLGVRLIDRWISDRTIRFTLGLLLSLVAASLIVLLSTSDRPAAVVPRGTLVTLTCATIVTLGWMARALHHLGRTVHVDTSIAQLGRDAAANLSRDRCLGPPAVDMEAGEAILACQTGYMEEIDCAAILNGARGRGALVSLTHGLGDFMICGERIGWIVGGSGEWVTEHIVCAEYRSDTSGPVFEINLLVEVAARALSPSVNDFYSGLACCDRIAAMLAAALQVHNLPQWLPDSDGAPRLELPRERLTQFLGGPLHALRQTIAAYPAVTIHFLNLLGRLPCPGSADKGLCQFLLDHAEALADHACGVAELDRDRGDIASALKRARQHLSPRQM